MKKSVSYVAILFLLFSFIGSISHGSVLLKKKNTGILVVKTRDTNGNKLGNVSFTLDDKEYETNNKGTKKILVAARETHAIEFGEVEGYIINTPEGGTQTVEIEPGKKKIIVAIYEKTVPATPTPSQTPTPKPTETSIPTPTATVTATPTPKTAAIP